MRKRLLIGGGIFLVLILAGIFYYVYSTPRPLVVEEPLTQAQRLEALPANIELADTPERRTQGLSGRASIEDDYGLLFVFPTDSRHGFWMKDMQISIDMIWISAEGTIVHIEHAVTPATYPTIFTPANPARYVLETRAGYAKDRGWSVGTVLNLSTIKESSPDVIGRRGDHIHAAQGRCR